MEKQSETDCVWQVKIKKLFEVGPSNQWDIDIRFFYDDMDMGFSFI